LLVLVLRDKSESFERKNDIKAGEECESEVVVKKRKKSNPLVVYAVSESEEDLHIWMKNNPQYNSCNYY